MNDNVRRQQRRFMGYNLIAFTLIFTVFGCILYWQIRSSLYGPVAESVYYARDYVMKDQSYIKRQLALQNFSFPEELFKPGPEPDDLDIPVPKNQDDKGSPAAREDRGNPMHDLPMRVQAIIRDESGAVLNYRSLGRLYFDEYLEDIPYTLDAETEYTTTFLIGSSGYISLEFSMETEDGQTVFIQLISSLDAENSILQHFARLLVVGIVVLVILSITASYLLSRQTMAPLIRSWKRQTEFVENASHELRTPLTIIQNKLESLLGKPQSTIMDKAEEIGISLSETRRLGKLTSDLMTLARADSSEVQLEKERFQLDELIAQVSEPYQELATMQDKELKLELGCGQPVYADRNRIHQLMVILLDNALKYTGEGDHIFVRTKLQDNRAILEVADTGIGIPEESSERIFDRFYRADKARSRETGGSGLGLSIAKWIVDMHGGTIRANSNGGRGTVFQVRLKQ